MLNLVGKGVTNQTITRTTQKETQVKRENNKYYIEINSIKYYVNYNLDKVEYLYSTLSNDKHNLNTKRAIKHLSKDKFNKICKYWSIFKTNYPYKYDIENGRANITI